MKVEIPFSHGKLFLSLIVCFFGMAIGLWLTFGALAFSPSGRGLFYAGSFPYDATKILFSLLGLPMVLIFGLGFGYYFTKIFDRRSGMIVDKIGLICNFGSFPQGMIYWKDISSLSLYQRKPSFFDLTYLPFFDRYDKCIIIKKWDNTFFTLSSVALAISFVDLWNLLNEVFEMSKTVEEEEEDKNRPVPLPIS